MTRAPWVSILVGTAISLAAFGLVSAAASPPRDLSRKGPARATETVSLDSTGLALRTSLPSAALPSRPDEGLSLIDSSLRSVTFELVTTDYRIEPSAAPGDPCDAITRSDRADGLGTFAETGKPQLPGVSVMVGIPEGAVPSLAVVDLEMVEIPDVLDICLEPVPFVERNEDGQIVRVGLQSVRKVEHAAQGWTPGVLAEIMSTGFIRSQRVAQLRLHPFQYEPETGRLRVHQRIRIHLEFGATSRGELSADEYPEEGSFETVLQGALLNYEAAKPMRSVRRSVAASEEPASPTSPTYKLLIDDEGIYRVSCDTLHASGIATDTLDPRTLRVWNQGQEVGIVVTGEEDGSCNSGDAILFFGEAVRTRYSDTNVYWLTWGDGKGARMPFVDGTPLGAPSPVLFTSTARAEENTPWNYFSDLPSGADDDRWYWEGMWADEPTTQTYAIELPGLAVTADNANVRGLFRSYDAKPQHHTLVYLNGHLIADQVWPAQRQLQVAATVPHSYLLDATNVFSIVAPMDGGTEWDYSLINWFEVDYARSYQAIHDVLTFAGDSAGPLDFTVGGFMTSMVDVFDITTPLSPTRVMSLTSGMAGARHAITFGRSVSGTHRYIALTADQLREPIAIVEDTPSSLHTPANGADYIVIAHRDFISAANELAAYRAGQGLRTMAVDVQDIYDEFAGGVYNPEAIRDFLAYAYANWVAPAPAYVVLMGDGHYDFRDYYGWHDPLWLPPYLAAVDKWIGETAADNRYVCVSGSDNLPDMYLGRLPVRTAEQASAVVAKIQQYELGAPGEDWRRRTLCVADKYDPSAGDFEASCESIADNHLPPPYTQQRVYHSVTHSTPEEMRAAIIAGINAGRLLVKYAGHGSVQFWSGDKIFRIQDIASLTNNDRYPVMAPMTCLDGYYIWPKPPDEDYSSLGESVVREAARGAVASFSPTGYGEATGHDIMAARLYDALLGEGITQLGPATTLARLSVNGTKYGYFVDTYLLLGDPALSLDALRSSASITKSSSSVDWVYPGHPLTYTISYSNAGPDITHATITDEIPAGLTDVLVSWSGAPITELEGTSNTWLAPDLTGGSGGTITISAVVDMDFVGLLTNTVSITLTTIETDASDNQATVVNLVPHQAYLPLSLRSQ